MEVPRGNAPGKRTVELPAPKTQPPSSGQHDTAAKTLKVHQKTSQSFKSATESDAQVIFLGFASNVVQELCVVRRPCVVVCRGDVVRGRVP